MPRPPAPTHDPRDQHQPPERYVVVVGQAGRAVAEHLARLGTATREVGADGDAGAAVRGASLAVVDASLDPDTLVQVLGLAAEAQVPVVLEPVGAAEARAVVLGRHPVHTVTADLDELAALTGLATTTDEEVDEAVESVLARDVAVVWVRRGPAGSLLGRAGHRGTSPVPGQVGVEPDDLAAATAGYCRALLAGADPLDAVAPTRT